MACSSINLVALTPAIKICDEELLAVFLLWHFTPALIIPKMIAVGRTNSGCSFPLPSMLLLNLH